MTDTATARQTVRNAEDGALDVLFLYFEDCPSHERALELLEEVVREEDAPISLTVREVETEDEALSLGFLGSPTIRVNGKDIEPNVDSSMAGLTCRAYRTPSGRISPLPPREWIVQAVRQARSGGESRR